MGALLQDGLADGTVGRNITLTLTLTWVQWVSATKSEVWTQTIKYSGETQGNRARERLRWLGPAAYTKDRLILSSERAHHKNKTVTVKSNKYLVMSPRRGSTPRLADWPTVSRNVILTLTLTFSSVSDLHRDPASRSRRRKGTSQIWDSKIWSRFPPDSDPRMTLLARSISIYKRQTCPLVREGTPQKQAVIVKQ
jgi:hypothetical protein